MSLRDKLLADDRKFDTVEIPEWDVTVRIASMSFAALAAVRGEGPADEFPLRLIAACVLDDGDDSKLALTVDDVAVLATRKEALSGSPIHRLIAACSKINGLNRTKEEIKGES